MAHNEIQRTNYDAALAVAIQDAERRVIEAAEVQALAAERLGKAYGGEFNQYFDSCFDDYAIAKQNTEDAVRALRRVRDGSHA